MSQNDLSLANAAGAAFRADLNSALAALASLQSGTAEPSTPVAYMLWADTTNGLLKQRNAANTGWLEIGDLNVAALGILARIVTNLNFKKTNAAAALAEIARAEPYIGVTTAGAETGGLKLHAKTAGTLAQQVDIGDGVTLGAATGGAPGVGGLNAIAVKVNGASINPLGKHMIPFMAAALMPATTNGAAAGSVERSTNKTLFKTLDFDTATQEFAGGAIIMPSSWNEATITFVPIWTADSGSGGVVWALHAVAVSNDDATDVAFGTEQTSTDTLIATGDLHRGPESAAITIAGTPAANDTILFRIKRNVSNGSDTLAADARLIGLEVYITIDAAVDAA